MIPVIVVFIYLAVTLYIGSIAFRKSKDNTEDFFLANRTIGPMVFFMSLFATNMTAFAILGSSGLAFRRGVGVYGLMASSSGFMIPLTIFLIGTRLWSLGKRFGHMTQVQFFRDRWECSGIGTCIFGLSVAMLVPYMIISIMGGGRVLHDISSKKGDDGRVVMLQVMKDGQPVMVEQKTPVKGEDGKPVMIPVVKDGKPALTPDGKPVLAPKMDVKMVPKMEADCYVSFEIGAAIVAIAVTSIVFFGGMRGTVWVNIFQTLLFLLFGTVAIAVIGGKLPNGFASYFTEMANDPAKSFYVTRERISEREFWSYTLIPLSSIMFPHMSIMCLSARKVSAFKRTVVLYPLAIMAIWLPCIFLGVIASQVLKQPVPPGTEDGVLLLLLNQFAPPVLAGILGAGIISAVMGSDCHQVLAISTMFTKDLFQYYGGQKKYGEKGGVWFARAFIIVLTLVAYGVALVTATNIFELAIRYAFSGFAAMAPVMLAALFWKRSTKWGALASTLYVAASLVFYGYLQYHYKTGDVIVPGAEATSVPWLESAKVVGDIRVMGFMTVVPMVFGSAICMVIGSLLTRPPSAATIERYFSKTATTEIKAGQPELTPAA